MSFLLVAAAPGSGQQLCRPEVWGLEPHLLAIGNDLNVRASLRPYAEEFEDCWKCLRLPVEHTHILSWQESLTQAEATMDPTVPSTVGSCGAVEQSAAV